MKITPIPLRGALTIDTSGFEDERGKFVRFFCSEELKDVLGERIIKQINYSLTVKKGAIRGMHFQYSPKAETKLVRCTQGSVFDVVVDLRKNAKTFLKWYGLKLSSENMKMLYIPEGFAHGFQTLDDNCEMLYLHTECYSPSYEAGICYNDPKIGIEWPLKVTDVSDRDCSHSLLTSGFAGIDACNVDFAIICSQRSSLT